MTLRFVRRRVFSRPAGGISLAVAAIASLATLPQPIAPSADAAPAKRSATSQPAPPPLGLLKVGDAITVPSGFDNSRPLATTQLAPARFRIDVGPVRTLLLRVEGAKGKDVQFDLSNSPAERWVNLMPVYSVGVTDLTELKAYDSDVDPDAVRRGLSKTPARSWRYARNVWRDGKLLLFIVRCESDVCYIGIRVPYVPEYNQRFLRSLDPNRVTVTEVGSLRKVSRSSWRASCRRRRMSPSRASSFTRAEHAHEHDANWAAQGALQFLASDSAEAAKLRARFDFVIVPLLDPDGATTGMYENVTQAFTPESLDPTAIAYTNLFKGWIDSGRRIDLAINLHNPALESLGTSSVPSLTRNS